MLNEKLSLRQAASDLALEVLFPSILWLKLLKLIRSRANIAADFGFEVILKPLSSNPYRECCKI